MKLMRLILQCLALASLILLAVTMVTGCGGLRLKGGTSTVTSGPVRAVANQSQDPKDGMNQAVESDGTEESIIPAGSVVETIHVTPAAAGQAAVTNMSRTTIAAPMTVKKTHHESTDTKVGAAQKNTAAEIMAKLRGVRWLQIVGLLVAAFGAASLFYPPLKLIVNSVTTSMWCIAAGGALVFLPILIVGHELLILGVCAAVVGLWFFAHRHGGVSAEVKLLRAQSPVPTPATATENKTGTEALKV